MYWRNSRRLLSCSILDDMDCFVIRWECVGDALGAYCLLCGGDVRAVLEGCVAHGLATFL